MANFMFVLRPAQHTYKTVCPACAQRGEVVNSCNICHGAGTQKHYTTQYYVQDRPIKIEKIDRDPKTGILRYWEGFSDFYYETIYPELNKYTEYVPFGIHLCHDEKETAIIECERVNKYLLNKSKSDKLI